MAGPESPERAGAAGAALVANFDSVNLLAAVGDVKPGRTEVQPGRFGSVISTSSDASGRGEGGIQSLTLFTNDAGAAHFNTSIGDLNGKLKGTLQSDASAYISGNTGYSSLISNRTDSTGKHVGSLEYKCQLVPSTANSTCDVTLKGAKNQILALGTASEALDKNTHIQSRTTSLWRPDAKGHINRHQFLGQITQLTQFDATNGRAVIERKISH